MVLICHPPHHILYVLINSIRELLIPELILGCILERPYLECFSVAAYWWDGWCEGASRMAPTISHTPVPSLSEILLTFTFLVHGIKDRLAFGLISSP
jgi:hypothetical protein